MINPRRTVMMPCTLCTRGSMIPFEFGPETQAILSLVVVGGMFVMFLREVYRSVS